MPTIALLGFHLSTRLLAKRKRNSKSQFAFQLLSTVKVLNCFNWDEFCFCQSANISASLPSSHLILGRFDIPSQSKKSDCALNNTKIQQRKTSIIPKYNNKGNVNSKKEKNSKIPRCRKGKHYQYQNTNMKMKWTFNLCMIQFDERTNVSELQHFTLFL